MRAFSLALLLAAPAPALAQRTLDGHGNSPVNPEFGAADTALHRLAAPAYADGFASPAGADRPSARTISNAVLVQSTSRPDPSGVSAFLFAWGQFLDHDIDLTDPGVPLEPFPIAVPANDPRFAPGTQIPFFRSAYDAATGTGPSTPRQQTNAISAWIDASQVYGSDARRAAFLRAPSGRLKTSAGDLLPFNTAELPNAGGAGDPSLFIAGDVRANEQLGLTTMHALFVREHNRLAAEIAAADPELSSDAVYERARALVGALMQVITYREFLPALLGPRGMRALGEYCYDPELDPAISNAFSTAAFRFGHSALPAELLRLGPDGQSIAAGPLSLRDAFFNPEALSQTDHGIEPLLRGFARQPAERIDTYVIEDVRSFLFGDPSEGGLDLAALNIQRGRDHGLPSYNDMRRALGMRPIRRFEQLTGDREVQARLRSVYASVEDIDLWVGGLAERRIPGALVGPLFFAIAVDQFSRLRDADAFWYEAVLQGEELESVRRTRLADVIARNTTIERSALQDDVFFVPCSEPGEGRAAPGRAGRRLARRLRSAGAAGLSPWPALRGPHGRGCPQGAPPRHRRR